MLFEYFSGLDSGYKLTQCAHILYVQCTWAAALHIYVNYSFVPLCIGAKHKIIYVLSPEICCECYFMSHSNLFMMGEERGVCRVLVGKPEGKRQLGGPRRRCVINIRVDLQEVGCGYMNWTGLAQDRDRWRTLVSAVMNLRVS